MPSPLLPAELIDREVEAICERYKVTIEQAQEIVAVCFGEKPDLVARIGDEHGTQDVTRWKDYRKVVKEVRKRVYYLLRRYHGDRDEESRLRGELAACLAESDHSRIPDIVSALSQLHVSTRERYPYLDAFYSLLFGEIEVRERVLDVGCGFHPLTYPFGEETKRYVGVEKDLETYETLCVFAPMAEPSKLVPICGSFEEVASDSALTESEPFDVAFMFKLVPVIARAEPDSLGLLAKIQADLLVVTASKEAMTRNEDVSRREDKSLRAFVEMTGRSDISRFDVGNEFGYFVR
ncbi:MAG: hypothetical protein VX910_07400 [Candidatus Latescibacterota bacterium]|nr:hypothetical protein [Candidatus Latescibacterota bacterium]